MSNFIRNIKNHKKAAVICAAVLIIAAALTVLAIVHGNRGGKGSRTLYFEGSDYPVYVTEYSDKLVFELDGSKTKELSWTSELKPYGIARVDPKQKEKKGKLTYNLEPYQTGYATISFVRSSTIKDISYNVAEIYADFYVAADEKGNLKMSLVGMRQNLATAGALNTDTPYLVDGKCVLLPNGGDWTMTAEIPEGYPRNLFLIYQYTDENGHPYFETLLYPAAEIRNSPELEGTSVYDTVFVLKSASLGIEQRLQYKLNGDSEWVLSAAGDSNG